MAIDQIKAKEDLTISYMLLRRLIGLLGISLPFVLAFGSALIGSAQAIQPSISHYYYSVMHVVFVGVLCLLGGFLVSYRGPHAWDNRTSNFAGAFAIGVAAFPTDCKDFIPLDLQYILVPTWQKWMNWVHYGCAGSLFVCFSVFCFYIFQADDSGASKEQFGEKKKNRNKFYGNCGWIIAISIGCIAAISAYEAITKKSLPFSTYSTIFFETTALLAFGSSWLLKGTFDMKEIPRPLHRFVRSYREVEPSK